MLKEYKKSIKFLVFGYTVDIVFSSNVVESVKKRNVRGNVEDAAACHIYYESNNKSIIVFSLKPSINEITHEAYHAINQIMLHTGATHDSEVMAYHMGYLVERICILNKNYKKRKSGRLP
jgi:hypothetical protein